MIIRNSRSWSSVRYTLMTLGLSTLISFFSTDQGVSEETYESAGHRLVLLGGGLTQLLSEGNTEKGGNVEVLSYEFVDPVGWSVTLSLLNFHWWEGVIKKAPLQGRDGSVLTEDLKAKFFAYTPVWYRYYFRSHSRHWWPFGGVGLGIQGYSENDLTNFDDSHGLSIRPVLETGIDLGGRINRHHLSVRYFFKGNQSRDKARIGFAYAISFGRNWKE